jgi:hypothetical protein
MSGGAASVPPAPRHRDRGVEPAGARAQNIDRFVFTLDADDLEQIASLDRGGRIGPNPDTFGG